MMEDKRKEEEIIDLLGPSCRVSEEILAERHRQITDEGWFPEHDDQHADGEMAQAAACYAWSGCWPWDVEWDKRLKHGRRKQLIIAAALLIAEIERLDRCEGKVMEQQGPDDTGSIIEHLAEEKYKLGVENDALRAEVEQLKEALEVHRKQWELILQWGQTRCMDNDTILSLARLAIEGRPLPPEQEL
jgi:hypothetical protein